MLSDELSHIQLHNVLHVPKLHNNVFSIPSATKDRKSVKFADRESEFFNPDGQIFCKALKRDELYYLCCPDEHSLNTSKSNYLRSDLWHARYGHFNFKSLSKLSEKIMVLV